jgi:cytochrome c biogenesis protein CcmG, thiol:disulfide interchange protein DsbE
VALSERRRDGLLTAGFLLLVGGLVALGWVTRESTRPVAAGDPAPELRLPLLDGDTASLADYRGKVVMLNIWATWCPPCVTELPSMQRVYETFADQGLEILAVAVDALPGERQADGRVVGVVSEFVDRFGLTFPVALDPTGGTERLLEVNYLPTTFLIDREGRIRVREVGGRYWDAETNIQMIEALLGEGRV